MFSFLFILLLCLKQNLFVDLSPLCLRSLAVDRLWTRNRSPFRLSLKGGCSQSGGVTRVRVSRARVTLGLDLVFSCQK